MQRSLVGSEMCIRDRFLSNGEEFSYIFRDGAWVAYDMNEFNDNDPEIVEIPAGNLAV